MLQSFKHVSHGNVFLGLDLRKPRSFKLVPFSNFSKPSEIEYPEAFAWERSIAWQMLGNDTVGDCVIAKTLHQIMAWETVAHAGDPATSFTTEQAINLYSAVTGYNPADPNSDQGTDPMVMLQYWQNTGVYGHKIEGGVSLDISNLAALKAAIYVFGGVEFDINVPAYVMNVPAGGSWSNTGGDQTILGGHSILACGYGRAGCRIVSWGTTYTADWDFWSQFLIGSTAAVSTDWLKASGRTPGAGLDLQGLLAALPKAA